MLGARSLLMGAAALLCLTSVGCGPTDGDDDPVDTPTPGEATPTPGPITLAGTVSITDSSTGELFTEDGWKSCFGPIIIYLLNDPTDLQRPADKIVIDSPGDFSFVVDPNSGNYYVTAIADTNRNYYISSADTLMEYVYNPVGAGTMDASNLDIEMEANGCGGGCCSGGGTDTTYSTYQGRVLVDPTVPSNAIYMALNDETFKGPYSASLLYEPGTYTLYGREDRLSKATILGILDLDDNGLFEPSDMIGVPEGNPYDVGDLGDELSFGDIDLVIGPDTVILDQPLVPVYVPVTGVVTYEGEPNATIFVNLSSSQPRGPLISGTRLDGGSRSFLLRSPQNTGNLWLWGVVDENGDGVGDPATEAWGKLGPLRTDEEGLYNLELALVPPGEQPPTPTPTEEPTETSAPTPTATATATPTPVPTTPTEPGEEPTPIGGSTPTPDPDTTPADGPTPGEGTPTADATPTTGSEATPTPTAVPTPTATPEPIMAELMGEVSYDGPIQAGDVLRVGAQVREPEEGTPDYIGVSLDMTGQSFPMAFHIVDLPPGSFGLYAYLDHGGNNPDGPGSEDIEGWYTLSGELEAPATFVLESGEVREDMNLSLFY